MRINPPARASVSVLVSIFVLVSASACASEDETAQQGERFDDIVGKRTPGTDGEKKAEPPADTPESPPELTPAPNEDTPAPGDAPPTSCEAARDLGVVYGDQGTPSISAHGSCSEWLRVRVAEAWKGPTAGTMRLTATLISPEDEDFDVSVYLNQATDILECSKVTVKSDLPVGRSDVVKSSWGERYTFNNSDDSRTVSIEIKKKNGGCAAKPWALLLQGNY